MFSTCHDYFRLRIENLSVKEEQSSLVRTILLQKQVMGHCANTRVILNKIRDNRNRQEKLSLPCPNKQWGKCPTELCITSAQKSVFHFSFTPYLYKTPSIIPLLNVRYGVIYMFNVLVWSATEYGTIGRIIIEIIIHERPSRFSCWLGTREWRHRAFGLGRTTQKVCGSGRGGW